MSEEKTATLAAKIIHVQKKEELATVEQTLAFAKESDAEQDHIEWVSENHMPSRLIRGHLVQFR